MEKNHYPQVVYPFQDKILRIIEQLPVNFYLTGDTALCRGYFHHRYSADLDFCLNADDNFQHQLNLIIDELTFKNFFPELISETPYQTEVIIRSNELSLRIIFINDIQFRVGKPSQNLIFKSIDNIDNILSNKILLMENLSTLDIIDIIFISLNHTFNWNEVFKNAMQKNIWIEHFIISNIFKNFSVLNLDEINWINNSPNISQLFHYSEIISKDILELTENSLYQRIL